MLKVLYIRGVLYVKQSSESTISCHHDQDPTPQSKLTGSNVKKTIKDMDLGSDQSPDSQV